jgi:hypothetical protein
VSLTALPAPASLRRTHPADGQPPDAPSAATPLQATPDAKLMSISFRGRTTERAYPQPVSYVHDGDTLLTPAGGKWKLNHRRSADPTVAHGPQDLGATRVRSGRRRGRTAPPLMTTCNPVPPRSCPSSTLMVTSTKAKWRRRSPTHRRRHTLRRRRTRWPHQRRNPRTHVRRQNTVGLPGPAGAEGPGRSCPVEADSSGCPAS